MPGSGKTTYIQKNYPEATVCSADHFFSTETGEYKFDPTKLGQAHGASQNLCELSMKLGKQNIISDNTNLNNHDRKAYEDLARKYGYHVQYVIFQIKDLDLLAKRNAHNVPRFVYDRLIQKMTVPDPKIHDVIFVSEK